MQSPKHMLINQSQMSLQQTWTQFQENNKRMKQRIEPRNWDSYEITDTGEQGCDRSVSSPKLEKEFTYHLLFPESLPSIKFNDEDGDKW